jgi:arylsulfatase A-like enzyme
MFGKWGLGNPGDSGEPTQQGFDEYFGYLHQGHAHNYYPEFLFRNGEKIMLENVVPKATRSGAGKASVKATYSHDLFIQESLRFLDEHSEEPFFLYIPLTIPHANNEAGKEGMEVPDLGEYATEDWPAPQKGMAAMVSRMDAGIGEILDRLETLGVSQNTIVIFTSDNGPHREGGNNPNFFDSNGALRGIKRSLHDGGIRVPTIVRWPDRVAAGSTSSVPWMFADVLPTLAEAATQPSPAGITGESVLATWTGKEQDLSHRTLYWEFHEGGFKQAARRGAWKAVRLTGAGKPVQLYDLGKDPGEANNVAADHLEIVAEFEVFFDTARTPSKRWPGA